MKENENVKRIVDEWWREFQERRTPSASPPEGEGDSRANRETEPPAWVPHFGGGYDD